MAKSIDHFGSNRVPPLWARPFWAGTIQDMGNNRVIEEEEEEEDTYIEEWDKEMEKASEEPRSEPDSMPRLATGK